ncbi:MAG: 2-hydroxychromene-2-carboxylate isomerase [Acidimicrobiales bacterium]|jgi:hypothetical protein
MSDHDINFYWDPVCPFAWITSRWIRMVQEQRDYTVDWRFISLRVLNKDKDYDTEFPPEYEAGHNAGLYLLRMAAQIRHEHGREAMGDLYTALGESIFDVDPAGGTGSDGERTERRASWGTAEHVTPILERLNLPLSAISALDDPSWDEEIEAETEEALLLTGRDVGTPIITFQPPDGLSFFGPVISRLPTEAEAGDLWDSVINLASFGGFTEMKRSLRERPQLRSFGVKPGEVGKTEDWHGGSRRLKK